MRLDPRLVALGAFAVLLLGGCYAEQIGQGRPGHDLGLLRTGTPRALVEKTFGEAIRVWRPSAERCYGLYRCREPNDGKKDMAAILFMDAITLGVSEAAAFARGEHPSEKNNYAGVSPSRYHWIWIAYDSQDRVCGTYAEFDVLPAGPVSP